VTPASSQRWAVARRVVERAIDLPHPERAALVRDACASDAELRAMVDALLESDGVSTEELFARQASRRAGSVFVRAELAELNGPGLEDSEIGPYVVGALLGIGGMGVVHRARRHDGEVVALKLLHPGPFAQDLARSFRRERSLLARLAHPAIPRLLDAGVTPSGVSWLALELVEGERIDRHCGARRLSLRERVALFGRVCAAVQHAHAQRVVHRDLKPQNLLVTADGAPKLLDFGIARLLQGDAACTLFPVLTPQYASPEQFRGGAPRVENDVYALGAILHELLVGLPPYRVGGLSLAAAARVVGLGLPRPPSAAFARLIGRDPGRAAEIAAQRATTPSLLLQQLRAGLDEVVLRAMHRDPRARYASAAELLRDLERVQSGRMPRASFVRALRRLPLPSRRALAPAALLTSLTALGAFAATRPDASPNPSATASTAASTESTFARTRATLARVFDVTSRMQPGKAWITLEWLEQIAHDLEHDAEQEPSLVGEGLAKIGEQCRNLRMPQLAVRHFEVAADCFRRVGEPARDRLVRALYGLAVARVDLARSNACDAAEEALATAHALEPGGGPLTSEALLAGAIVRARRVVGFDAAEADAALAAAEPALLRTHGEADELYVHCLHERGALLTRSGRPAQAEPVLRHAIELAAALGTEGNGRLVALLRTLAAAQLAQSRPNDAEVSLLRSLSLARTRIDEAWTPPTLLQLADLERETGRLRLAELYARRALALHALRASAGNVAFTTRLAPAIAALTTDDATNARAACLEVDEALATRRDGATFNRYDFTEALACLARVWTAAGEPDLARPLLVEAANFFEENFGSDFPQAKRAKERLAALPSAP
jgi:serine/threonine protein kinase/tetratricopeptide (TPR) repeat protein